MAEPETDLKPESSVLTELSDLYVACLTATEQIRRLKIRYKVRYKYCRLVEMLKCMLYCQCCHNVQRDMRKGGECVVCWSFCVLHRIENLGGDAESTIGTVIVYDDVQAGLITILQVLQKVYDAAQAIINDETADKPTAKIAGEIQCAADHHIECVKAHLRQIDDLGKDYLITLV